MPIIGLTDKTATGAGLPTIAKLYKGSEKEIRTNQQGRQYETVGKDLDYFRVEFEPQFAHLAPIWNDLYGSEPTDFSPVFLPAGTVEEAFASWKEEWNSSGTLLHRCDGQHQVMHWSEQSQMYSKAKIPCASPVNPVTGQVDKQCGCRATGRMNIILPEFVNACGVLGYVSITTHSLHDILTVYRYLMDIQRGYGRLDGVPFIFGRATKEVSAPKQVKDGGQYVNKGRIKVTKSLFYLHVDPDFVRDRMLLSMTNSAPALPPTVSQDTGEIMGVGEAKKLLGSGGGNRRLGATEDKTPSPDEPEVNGWLEDEQRVQRFRGWAKERYSYDDTHILAALGTAAGEPLESLTDWTGNDVGAMAAVIAQYYEYDIGQITRACRNYTIKGLEAYALVIAKNVMESGLPDEMSS